MKIIELLNKYREILAPILGTNPKDIKFYIRGRGETMSDKKVEEEITTDLHYQKSNNWALGTYVIKVKDEVISSWRLYEMPHCCAFMMSCNVHVNHTYRNKGIGTILNTFRQDIGRVLGYSSIICTDVEQNTPQRKLLKTNGWVDIHSVINKRTKNRVYISVINI